MSFSLCYLNEKKEVNFTVSGGESPICIRIEMIKWTIFSSHNINSNDNHISPDDSKLTLELIKGKKRMIATNQNVQ